MKKVLYYLNECLLGNPGIEKKCNGQIKAFQRLGYSVDVHQFSDLNHSKRLVNNQIVEHFQEGYFNRKKFIFDYSEILNFINANKYDLIYIRYTYFSNFIFFRFLKEIKKNNPNCKIVIEIPTYPYDREVNLKFNSKSLFRVIERFSRGDFSKYINYVVTYSSDSSIFGVEAINIENAIDADIIETVKPVPKKDTLNILCLANFSFWHGYDRLLNGLFEYRGKKNVVIYFVGSGNEVDNLKAITEKNSLWGKVKFLGIKTGFELDEVINNIDIAVDSLGRHRSGHNENSSLKSKEYLAKGLPFIKSHADKAIDELKLNSVFQVSADESPIDIKELINWFEQTGNSNEELINAAKQFTWDNQIKKVISKL
ncbi:glycosyltransferase [Vibrio cyclitrophicus]